jgi:hypothetical protein
MTDMCRSVDGRTGPAGKNHLVVHLLFVKKALEAGLGEIGDAGLLANELMNHAQRDGGALTMLRLLNFWLYERRSVLAAIARKGGDPGALAFVMRKQVLETHRWLKQQALNLRRSPGRRGTMLRDPAARSDSQRASRIRSRAAMVRSNSNIRATACAATDAARRMRPSRHALSPPSHQDSELDSVNNIAIAFA